MEQVDDGVSMAISRLLPQVGQQASLQDLHDGSCHGNNGRHRHRETKWLKDGDAGLQVRIGLEQNEEDQNNLWLGGAACVSTLLFQLETKDQDDLCPEHSETSAIQSLSQQILLIVLCVQLLVKSFVLGYLPVFELFLMDQGDSLQSLEPSFSSKAALVLRVAPPSPHPHPESRVTAGTIGSLVQMGAEAMLCPWCATSKFLEVLVASLMVARVHRSTALPQQEPHRLRRATTGSDADGRDAAGVHGGSDWEDPSVAALEATLGSSLFEALLPESLSPVTKDHLKKIPLLVHPYWRIPVPPSSSLPITCLPSNILPPSTSSDLLLLLSFDPGLDTSNQPLDEFVNLLQRTLQQVPDPVPTPPVRSVCSEVRPPNPEKYSVAEVRRRSSITNLISFISIEFVFKRN
ncbi:hypothetical protein CCH79_00020627 [Gambusia affinis]|uniref:Uncharacterized protein n=1 Tax=Gambusia affinis TaxID=33528 RepID=A0A315VTM7_GAMAF|nr:hypothetical protein CCH79_00020627 [Gambusia affinis]